MTLAYDEIWQSTIASLSELGHLEGVIQQALFDTIPRRRSLQVNIADVVIILGKENQNPTVFDDGRMLDQAVLRLVRPRSRR